MCGASGCCARALPLPPATTHIHAALAAAGAALILCDEVCSQINVRDEPLLVKDQPRALQGAVAVRGAVVILHSVAVGLVSVPPHLAIRREKVAGDNRGCAVAPLTSVIGVVNDVNVAADVKIHCRIFHSIVHASVGDGGIGGPWLVQAGGGVDGCGALVSEIEGPIVVGRCRVAAAAARVAEALHVRAIGISGSQDVPRNPNAVHQAVACRRVGEHKPPRVDGGGVANVGQGSVVVRPRGVACHAMCNVDHIPQAGVLIHWHNEVVEAILCLQNGAIPRVQVRVTAPDVLATGRGDLVAQSGAVITHPGAVTHTAAALAHTIQAAVKVRGAGLCGGRALGCLRGGRALGCGGQGYSQSEGNQGSSHPSPHSVKHTGNEKNKHFVIKASENFNLFSFRLDNSRPGLHASFL